MIEITSRKLAEDCVEEAFITLQGRIAEELGDNGVLHWYFENQKSLSLLSLRVFFQEDSTGRKIGSAPSMSPADWCDPNKALLGVRATIDAIKKQREASIEVRA